MSQSASGMQPDRATDLVRLAGLSKRFGSFVAVKPLDLTIERGEFFAILGPSGCGKTTLLRMIGGFIAPSGGTIAIDGVEVTRSPPERRPTNMVFQSYGLFPHMTVRQNIGYGLRLAGNSPAETQRRVDEIVSLVHLESFADRPVTALSGGQQQRVALARALVLEPKVLLLDEPLAALDLKLRKAMQAELRRIHQTIGGTFVLVSHDQAEVMSLADRVAVMDSGSVVQIGSPREIYEAPATRFVSGFIGDANFLRGRRSGGVVALPCGTTFPDAGLDQDVVVMIRPEKISLNPVSGDLALDGRIADIVFFGQYIQVKLQLPDGTELIVHAPEVARADDLRHGDACRVAWRSADHKVFPEE